MRNLLITLTVIVFPLATFSSLHAADDVGSIQDALVQYLSGNLDSAEILSHILIHVQDTSAIPYICLGNIECCRARDLKKKLMYDQVGPALSRAIGYYRQALAIQSNNPTALINLSMSYYELNQFEQARKFLVKALEIEPDNACALQNMGNALFWVYDDSSDYRESIRYWTMALDLCSPEGKNRAVLWKNIGIAYYKMGNSDSAASAFRESLKLDSSSAETFVLLGRTLEILEPYQAISFYKKALAIDSYYVSAIGAWTQALCIISSPDLFTFGDKAMEVRKYIRQALKNDPRNAPKYHLFLGDLYMAENKIGPAESEYVKARELDSSLNLPSNWIK